VVVGGCRWFKVIPCFSSYGAFLAWNVLFGFKTLPETTLYWSKDTLLGVPAVHKIMPRNHLEKLCQYLHLNNQDNMFNIERRPKL